MEKQTTQEYEKAIAYIIDRIKEGSLQLGSKLPPERKIAEELGIGRNSIREAISILSVTLMIITSKASFILLTGMKNWRE